jgi:hypothetical protein
LRALRIGLETDLGLANGQMPGNGPGRRLAGGPGHDQATEAQQCAVARWGNRGTQFPRSPATFGGNAATGNFVSHPMLDVVDIRVHARLL